MEQKVEATREPRKLLVRKLENLETTADHHRSGRWLPRRYLRLVDQYSAGARATVSPVFQRRGKACCGHGSKAFINLFG